jgi:phospholipid transport system substrate-binding protein
MNFPKTEPVSDDFTNSLDHAALGTAPSAASALPRGVAAALADPIVKALMAADRVDPNVLETSLRRTAASLARRAPRSNCPDPVGNQGPLKTVAGTTLATLAKGVALALAAVVGLSGAPSRAVADDAPIAFVRTLGAQAVSVIRSDMPLTSKADYFDQMVRQDFDLTDIARFVLGPYWRVASPAERQQFCDNFADRLVRDYGRQLAQSGDGDFVVTGSRPDLDGGVIVTSRIVRPQGAPLAVDWRLEISGGLYKIEDVTIDGVSMALTQRSEIGALIGRTGGQVGMVLGEVHG